MRDDLKDRADLRRRRMQKHCDFNNRSAAAGRKRARRSMREVSLNRTRAAPRNGGEVPLKQLERSASAVAWSAVSMIGDRECAADGGRVPHFRRLRPEASEVRQTAEARAAGTAFGSRCDFAVAFAETAQ
jgi:hypothetical protein